MINFLLSSMFLIYQKSLLVPQDCHNKLPQHKFIISQLWKLEAQNHVLAAMLLPKPLHEDTSLPLPASDSYRHPLPVSVPGFKADFPLRMCVYIFTWPSPPYVFGFVFSSYKDNNHVVVGPTLTQCDLILAWLDL